MSRKPTTDEITRLEADGWERDGNHWHAPLKYWPAGTVVLAAMTTTQAIKRMALAAQEATR